MLLLGVVVIDACNSASVSAAAWVCVERGWRFRRTLVQPTHHGVLVVESLPRTRPQTCTRPHPPAAPAPFRLLKALFENWTLSPPRSAEEDDSTAPLRAWWAAAAEGTSCEPPPGMHFSMMRVHDEQSDASLRLYASALTSRL